MTPDDGVIGRERRLRARVQAVGASGDHHALHEHAGVEPAAALHVAIEREEQSHRRAEESEIAAVLAMHAGFVVPHPSPYSRVSPMMP